MDNNVKKTKIKCSFEISWFDRLLSHKSISESLEIIPTRYWKAGDINRNKTRTYNYWSLETDLVESLSIINQINELLNKLIPAKTKLIELKSRDASLEYRIQFVVEIYNNQTPGMYIDANTISFCNSIEATIDIDSYVM